MSFSRVYQDQPLGNAHAVLQAEKAVGGEPCAVLFSDDIVESETPCLLQMMEVFQRYQRPILSLAQVPSDSIPNYGIVEVDKIAKNLYKIKRVVEKPQINESPSNLAIVGKYLITPDVFSYIKKIDFKKEHDKSISEVFNDMIEDGQTVYGYEFEGKWLECGNKSDFLKTNFYLSLKNPLYREKLKEVK